MTLFALSKKNVETFIRPGKPVVVKFVEPAVAHHDLARDGDDSEFSVTSHRACNDQALVESWRCAGKKVTLSFGGAGMGGSWSGALLFVLVYGTGVYLSLKIFAVIFK